MKFCLILLSAILSVSESLKVYSRTISSADLTKKIGLRYHNNQAKEEINWENGMTICVDSSMNSLELPYWKMFYSPSDNQNQLLFHL